MGEIVLPRDSQALSDEEFAQAQAICVEALASVQGRDAYLSEHSLDRAFALPDANWSYASPNEFLKVFLRLARGERLDLDNLRAFCQVFSGYNIYQVRNSANLTTDDTVFSAELFAQLASRLPVANSHFVDKWHALVQGIPERYRFKPPARFGECGHRVDGVIVNYDTTTYQERINLLYCSGVIDRLEALASLGKPLRICEIGGGYGAVAHWFRQAFPECAYTIIDLPESLLFSRLFLSLSCGTVPTGYGLEAVEGGLRFLPNFMAQQLDEPFDLVINTLSFSEMSLHQVQTYVDLIKTRFIAHGGLFFEQNQDNRHIGFLFAQSIFEQAFPYRKQLSHYDMHLENGYPNVWGVTSFELTEPELPDRSQAYVALLEDLGVFNLVRVGGHYFCLRKSLGPVDVTTLPKENAPPHIFFGHTPEAAIAQSTEHGLVAQSKPLSILGSYMAKLFK